ncbi:MULTISPECIES: hypothetical protein [Bacillus]|uniref:hypothetical protein n=1 Tax=Bacillus TaxID=1386 RepID=UPI00240E48C8|nr:hypothetical protein [Bacillus cereus]MDG1634182.1 hypothetical protein [Bacillus cereus]
MKISGYNPLIFANLYEFEIAKSLLEQYRHKIDEMGLIIKKHNLQQDIGVGLLHKHFNLFKNEVVVRHYSDNKITIKPEVHPDYEMVPYVFGFSKTTEKGELQLFPLEFISITDKTAHYRESINKVIQNLKFLNEISIFLKESKLENLFGLSLLPFKLFNVKGQLNLMETENKQGKRILTISIDNTNEITKTKSSPQDLDTLLCAQHGVDYELPELSTDEIIQTLWSFRENAVDEVLSCKHSCRHNCRGHGEQIQTHEEEIKTIDNTDEIIQTLWSFRENAADEVLSCKHSCRHSCRGHGEQIQTHEEEIKTIDNTDEIIQTLWSFRENAVDEVLSCKHSCRHSCRGHSGEGGGGGGKLE